MNERHLLKVSVTNITKQGLYTCSYYVWSDSHSLEEHGNLQNEGTFLMATLKTSLTIYEAKNLIKPKIGNI